LIGTALRSREEEAGEWIAYKQIEKAGREEKWYSRE